MARTGLSFAAWAVATTAGLVVYGGTIYFVSIAMKWRIDLLLERLRLGFVVSTWRKGFPGQVAVFAVVLLVLLPLEAVAIGPGAGPDEPRPYEPPDVFGEAQDLAQVTGTSTEGGGAVDATPDVAESIIAANITLQWVDDDAREPPGGPFGLTPKNRPDTLRLTVKLPGGQTTSKEAANDATTRNGEVRIGPLEASKGASLNGWEITVECVSAGDVQGRLVTYTQDTGNAWTLYVEYTFMVKASGNSTRDG